MAEGSPGRLEGLSREVRIRGLGLTSPRPVAARYAIALAREAPLLGLGYESFNMHLRAQLDIPSSAVARVVNTAVAQDASEPLFDDSHNTYLQVLAGTGAVGLGLWLALAAAGLLAAARALRRDGGPSTFAVLLALVLFHFYGLFQGMAYVPVIFFLFAALCGYATTLDPGPAPPRARRTPPSSLLALGALVLVSAVGYAGDRGYASLKRRFSVPAYLPDEAAEFEGFYRPETGPSGEFHWMSRRGILNVERATPFRLSITCDHPDAATDPVVLFLSFEGRDAGAVVFRRPGTIERRFDFGAPGALRLARVPHLPVRRRSGSARARRGGQRDPMGVTPIALRAGVKPGTISTSASSRPSRSPLRARASSRATLSRRSSGGRRALDRADLGPDLAARRRLLRAHQLLVELLARAKARDDDRDVLVGDVAGQRDHHAGEVEDPDRLAHLEDQQLAVAAEPGQQHQAHRLGDRHQVAPAVGVGHGHGAAPRDLLLEERHDAAGAAQHVAEAHRAEAGARPRRVVLEEELGHPLGGSHDARGVHRLVRRDEHEALDPQAVGGPDQVQAAGHVVLDGLLGGVLHERHVLVGGGVDDVVRTVLAEELLDAQGVADVHHLGVDGEVGVLPPEVPEQEVEVVLVDVGEHERGRERGRRSGGTPRCRSSPRPP